MIKLLSHLSFVTITAPDVEASVRFYEEQVGLTVVDRTDDAVYLRCWGDYYRYSVVIVAGDEPSLETMAWRTSSAEALEEAARRIEEAGSAGEWFEGAGIGRAYRFTGPYGHSMTLHWDVEHFHAEGDAGSIYPDRPSRRSRHLGAPRQLDHVTIASRDVDGFAKWYNDVLGFRIMARTVLDEAPISVFSVLTTNEKSHDLGVVLDGSSRPGRVNHYAFWVDQREDLLQAADILMENGVPMEYGPSIHGIGEQNFLYFRDPSTLRIEMNTGGYRNYVPDWTPNTWKPSLGSNNFYRNSAMPMSMTESFPPADGPSATEEGVPDEIKDALLNPYKVQGRG
ncbi:MULTISPECIES: VOC family protein [unclassified Rathayibacter]|uniref:VOC family protein n=1 Tax=unclassified Rathayibacter TaxID=2609250 RepID=UPI000CE93071|nr:MULTISPECIES: VOC family protein [unclassified Rathayibacter]PPG92775.1 catechol 1,2-dioxygenase [Rathayibacter sp. AY1F3]PPI41675.1 catechol 1,2-dioxygenase [Rathayibacter sp. RFBD1]PPI63176.1 catechol 1,2-dioxygenase [Rathayibacter sp. TRS19]QHC75038.1 catechol 1,2-dioxygenase [Rathayibacter sp. VKM Ac-2805]